MGFIKIETMIGGSEKISFGIESESLYKINCYSGQLFESLDRISEICIINNIFIVRTEDRDFRNGAQNAPFIKDERRENNVWIYDYYGSFKWNIANVLGDIKMAIDNVSCISKEKAEKEFGIMLPTDSEALIHCTALGFTYIIDVKNIKLLYKVAGRVK